MSTDKKTDQNSDLDGSRYPDGSIRLRNPNIELMGQDCIFVCMGGTSERMESFAHFIMSEIGYMLPVSAQLQDISSFSNCFCMYKVGPVLSVSHGMGGPSVGILLNELIKLMYHAKCKDPMFIRIGTSGGVGIESGTVVITEEAVDGMLRNTYEVPILGKLVNRPAKLDRKLARELKSLADPTQDPYDTVIGKTMCTDDFYESQARLNGAFCDFSETEQMDYLHKINRFGVVNIEMESTIFSALTHHAGIRAAIVSVTQSDRLKSYQVSTPQEVINEWQKRPQILVSRLIRKHLAQLGQLRNASDTCEVNIQSPRRFKLVQQGSDIPWKQSNSFAPK